jgi:hypothetical protein
MESTIAGVVAIMTPLLLGGFLFLRRHTPAFLFYLALSLVALGYLWSTGAVDDVGATVLEKIGGSAEDPAPAK